MSTKREEPHQAVVAPFAEVQSPGVQPLRRRRSERPAAALVLALGVALLATGCVSNEAEPAPVAPGKPAPVDNSASSLVVANGTDKVVFHLRVRGEKAETWGGDRLAPGDVFRPGEERRVRLVTGSYRVRAEFGDGSNWEGEAAVPADRPGVCRVPGKAPAREGKITIVNATPWAISKVYFSLVQDVSHGDERLGGKFLIKGATRTWTVPPGRYQLRVAFQDGKESRCPPSEVKPGKEATFRVKN